VNAILFYSRIRYKYGNGEAEMNGGRGEGEIMIRINNAFRIRYGNIASYSSWIVHVTWT
jgi:hypothetical protein